MGNRASRLDIFQSSVDVPELLHIFLQGLETVEVEEDRTPQPLLSKADGPAVPPESQGSTQFHGSGNMARFSSTQTERRDAALAG